MKVLVTGGQGFIGSYVCEELVKQNFDPIVFDRQDNYSHLGDFFLGDIKDASAVTEAMAHVEAWIHLAGVLGTAETIFNPRPAAEINILGGLNVLEAASQYNLPGVNIAVGNHWMNNTYSITKSTVERFAKMFRDDRGLPVTNVRALNAYGPGQSVASPYGYSKVRKIMPSFVCRALDGKDIEIYGDGEQVMDMIYVADVAKVLVGALNYTIERGAFGKTIEAGTGRDTTVNDIAEIVIEDVARRGGPQVGLKHLNMRHGEPLKSVVLANTEAMEKLGFDPASLVTLEEGVTKTVNYYSYYLANRESNE